ncbi:MAG: M48 family metallopeptidase [Halieaceae bacterium]|jgi:predicted Zn-dependent protease|nr:M48 family metallopeptidase [Halieaceae bacterium]
MPKMPCLRLSLRAITLLLATSLLCACATSPTGRSQLLLISPESAIVESRKAYVSTVRQLDAENKLLDDPLLADRVQLITGRLVAVAVEEFPRTRDWEWSVALIDGPETVNAWCMAGGRMAVYSGLFEKLKLTDDEFAQIMGHEISHALANHTAERMSVAMATSVGVVAAGVASENRGAALAGAALAAKLAIELPNSRGSESEADQIGIELAAKAGYDPAAAVTLWEKMETVSGAGPAEFLSTHPAPGNRRAKLTGMVPDMRAIQRKGFGAPYPVSIVREGSGQTL